MISFIQLLVTKLVEIQAFFFVGANYKKKDTFNKLGYKAKINTHTTSYIN